MPTKQPTKTIPSLPVDEILLNVAESVVKAQAAMDANSLATELNIRQNKLDRFGLSATWYTIPELNLDLRLAFEVGNRGEVTTRMVDAEYQSKYGFNVKASSLLNTKIVSIPPAETAGLSLKDERFVMDLAGQVKKIVEAYHRADTPYFIVRYFPFVRQGYNGGLWYAFLMDTLVTGERMLRALVVIDDASGEVLRLWTDEEVTVKNVTFTARQATRTIVVVNTAEEVVFKEIGLAAALVTALMAARPVPDLAALSAISGMGTGSLEKLKTYADTL